MANIIVKDKMKHSQVGDEFEPGFYLHGLRLSCVAHGQAYGLDLTAEEALLLAGGLTEAAMMEVEPEDDDGDLADLTPEGEA